MPLFVPILRLLMLFLNVYDSYKTLKQPPPSSRNGGRPSVRALTQRKRDMKGCLAVWIVWMCLTMYERVIESLVSLFIPFYDEFKSLVFVFLILTRARGAEPVYLHVIRPFLKPYTSTLDGALEVMLMFGDFIFALTTYPIRMSLIWWQKKFGPAEALDTEVETRTETSINDDAPEISTASSAAQQSISSHLPRKTNGSNHVGPMRRGSTDSTNRSHIYGLQGSSKSFADRTSQSSSSLPRDSEETINTVQIEEVEEWRKYPAFPSAYPPTPLVTTTRHLPTNPAFSAHLQPTSEHESMQDFRQSLMPPREPLNPSYAGDMSDKQHTFSFGIHPPSTLSTPSGAHSNFDTEDSLDYNDDEEDDFNITLRTPSNLMGSLSIQPPSRRFISQSSAISGISLPSRSSALTTLDMGSLKTNSDTESSPCSAIPYNETDSLSVVGKKRVHALAHSPSSPRVRQVRAQETSIPHRRRTRNSVQSTTARKSSKPISATRRRAIILPADDDPDFVSTTTGTDDEIIPPAEVPQATNQSPAEKRRKVSQLPNKGATSPARKSVAVRPLRQRVARQTSPTQPRRLKSVVLPDNKRTVTSASKSKTASVAHNRKTDHGKVHVSASASTSSDSLPLVPPKDK